MKVFFTGLLILATLAACAPFKANLSPHLANQFIQECGIMGDSACRAMYWVNYHRILHNLEPLENNGSCVAVAEFHAQDMQRFNYFSHDGRNETWEQRYARFGVGGIAAENIAEVSGPHLAVVGWMNSPGHRANILDPEMRSGGMGVAGDMYVQCFSTERP